MVRNYIRKTTRGNWSEESMKLAILAVKNDKLSYQNAADQYAMPKIALFRRVKNQLKLLGPDEQHRKILVPIKQVLSENIEKQLVTYIKQMDEKFYGLSINNLRTLV